MPHFIIANFHGREHYAIEYNYAERSADGSKRAPHIAIRLHSGLENMPLNMLIKCWKERRENMARALLAMG